MLAADVVAGMSGNIAIAMVGLGGALGVGMTASKAAEATGRNPGASGKIFLVAIIGMALAEGLAILTMFIAK